MHYEPRGAWRLVGGLLPAVAFTACAPGASGEEAASPERVALAADTGGAVLAQAVVPEVDIRIDGPGDCKYIEIDDLTPTVDTTDADANLCSNNSTDTTACPAAEVAKLADNPNFPGTSAASPTTLGSVEAEYCDWVDLDPLVHLDPFLDPSGANGDPDDILESDGCFNPDGNTPSKGNFTVTGLAADPTGTWLYTLLERDTSNGNESYEYYYLQNPTLFEEPNGCADGQYQFDPTPGDIRVVLSYSSTAALPEATAVAQIWEEAAPSAALYNPKELHQAGNWVTLVDAPVYPAINVTYNRQKSPTEDIERDFDGTALASGIKVEMALDIEAVFGQGCGLTRTMFGLSTASDSGAENDRIFDFLAPRVISTADVGTDLTLYESCDEEFGYLVEIDIDGPVSDFSNFDITGTYNCGAGDVAFTVAYSGDTIAIPVSTETTCEIDVDIDGTGIYEGCDAELSDTVTVYPTVEAAGTLDQDCTGGFSWDLDLDQIVSSASGVGVAWDFEVGGVSSAATDADDCTPPYDDATDDCGDGSSVVASSDGGAVSVSATLTVSDLTDRDTDGDGTAETTCPDVDVAVQGIDVHQPVTVTVSPTTADGECSLTDPNDPVDDVAFTVSITGGSGDYVLDYTYTDDAVNPTCADGSEDATDDQDFSDSCTYDLGSDFCAYGEAQLVVTDGTDSECCVGTAAADCADGISAERTSTLDVESITVTLP